MRPPAAVNCHTDNYNYYRATEVQHQLQTQQVKQCTFADVDFKRNEILLCVGQYQLSQVSD